MRRFAFLLSYTKEIRAYYNSGCGGLHSVLLKRIKERLSVPLKDNTVKEVKP